MKVALLVEGPSDERTLKILSKKIMGEQTGIETRILRGRGNLLNERKVYSHIVNIIQNHPDVSKIIICIDSECTPKDETEREMKDVENSLRAKIQQNYTIYYIGVIHALEGWLLTDRDNLRKYLGPRARGKILPSAALNCKPKEFMKNIFKRNGKNFLPTLHNPRIAEQIDIDKTAKNNESFKFFRDKVKDP